MEKNILKFQPTNVRMDKTGQFDFLCKFIRRKQDDGYICVAQKEENGWKQEFYSVMRIRNAASTANLYTHGDNIYISANSFANNKSRSKDNLKYLDCCFCDIDYRKKQHFANSEPDEVTQAILAFCRKYNVPLPTSIIATGNGLHIWWIFRKPMSASYLKVWESVQDALCDTFSRFGADPAAKDAARVLRIPGTYNTKDIEDKKKVIATYLVKDNRFSDLKPLYNYAAHFREAAYYSKIRANDSKFSDSTPLYQVKSIIESGNTQYEPAPAFIPFEPFSNITKNPITEPCITKEVKHRQRRNETEQECSDRHRDAAIGVRVNRILDINTLIDLRQGRMTGYRELTLFYLNHFLCRAKYNIQNRTKILNETNDKFTEKLPDNEVENILRHKHLTYDPKNETVIKALGISDTEQMMMRTLYNKEERKRRIAQNNKHGMSRNDYRAFMTKSILAYLTDGFTISDIADALFCTTKTIRNYINRFSLSTDGLVRCAKKENVHDTVQRHRDAKKAACACVEAIHSKVSSKQNKKSRQKGKDRTFDEIFKMKMVIAQAQNDFFENLKAFVKTFFEKTGKILATQNSNGKISYTPTFKRIVVLSGIPF